MAEIKKDCVIIGAGPSGLTAAMYLVRAGREIVIIEKGAPGGVIITSWNVENYPGYPDPVAGTQLGLNFYNQLRNLGGEVTATKVRRITKSGETFTVETDGDTYLTRFVIVASGAAPRLLEVPGEKENFGKGVSTCATCDGAFFKNQVIAVIGGGESAFEEGIFLTRFASKLFLIHRRQGFRAAASTQEKLKKTGKVEFVLDTVVEEILSDANGVTGLKLKNVKTNETRTLACQGVFIFIGHTPNTQFLEGLGVTADEAGYLLTGGMTCETNISGLYAIGDVRAGNFKQLAVGVGEGCTAALKVDHRLNDC